MVKCIDSPDSQKDESNTEKFMETERLAKNNNACKYSCNSGRCRCKLDAVAMDIWVKTMFRSAEA